MRIGPYLFKQKARTALKGKWQDALVITFFSTIFLTIASVLQSRMMEGVMAVANRMSVFMTNVGAEMTNEQMLQLVELLNEYTAAVDSIPMTLWIALGALYLVALFVTPVLTLGCNNYFINLIRGRDIGLREGFMARMPILLKAVWLNVRIFLQTFLWSLLFIVPGVIASIRYSMAPYFMAEDPTLTVSEAIRRSNEAMKGRKGNYFALVLSFIGWSLLISLVQGMLAGMAVVSIVAGLFLSVALNVYINASTAAFYHGVSAPRGMQDLVDHMRSRMIQAGIPEQDINAAGFGEPEVTIEEDEDAGEGEDE